MFKSPVQTGFTVYNKLGDKITFYEKSLNLITIYFYDFEVLSNEFEYLK